MKPIGVQRVEHVSAPLIGGKIELPIITLPAEPPAPKDLRPVTKTADGRSALLELRRFAAQPDQLAYMQGRIDLHTDGRISFVDLTMEQVELARMMTADPAQAARLAEFRVDWPGGRDPDAPIASYVALAQSGELDDRIRQLEEIKRRDAFGLYRSARADHLRYGGHNLNVGEEREISGQNGSGTVYFSGCSMKCVFCQFADIAHLKGGKKIDSDQLADIFLELQQRGAHNIQLMTPSHYALEIARAVKAAAANGLSIPLVWNTGGYEDLDALRALDGIVDIYLPDVKFGNDAAGAKYGGTKKYWQNVQDAVREMYRQVGNLEVDARGVARRGVLVRHLVMPGDVADATAIASFLASVSKDMHVNLMDGYKPEFAVPGRHHDIDRPITSAEYERARATFLEAGLHVALDRSHQSNGV